VIQGGLSGITETTAIIVTAAERTVLESWCESSDPQFAAKAADVLIDCLGHRAPRRIMALKILSVSDVKMVPDRSLDALLDLDSNARPGDTSLG
jgi:hypothetical protein